LQDHRCAGLQAHDPARCVKQGHDADLKRLAQGVARKSQAFVSRSWLQCE
jgi:hypothetical protein